MMISMTGFASQTREDERATIGVTIRDQMLARAERVIDE